MLLLFQPKMRNSRCTSSQHARKCCFRTLMSLKIGYFKMFIQSNQVTVWLLSASAHLIMLLRFFGGRNSSGAVSPFPGLSVCVFFSFLFWEPDLCFLGGILMFADRLWRDLWLDSLRFARVHCFDNQLAGVSSLRIQWKVLSISLFSEISLEHTYCIRQGPHAYRCAHAWASASALEWMCKLWSKLVFNRTRTQRNTGETIFSF